MARVELLDHGYEVVNTTLAIWDHLLSDQRTKVFLCASALVVASAASALTIRWLLKSLSEERAKSETFRLKASKYDYESTRPLDEVVYVQPHVDFEQDHCVTYHTNDRGPGTISVRADLIVSNFGLESVVLREVKGMSVSILWNDADGSAKSKVFIGDRLIGDRARRVVPARDVHVRVLSLGGSNELRMDVRHGPPVSTALFGSICIEGTLVSEDPRRELPFTKKAVIPFRIRNNC